MEETLETTCFISVHRNQINPTMAPQSTLTFAHGDRMYGKSTVLINSNSDIIGLSSILNFMLTLLRFRQTLQTNGDD